MKKCLLIIFATLSTVSALTWCAGRNFSSEQNNSTMQINEPIIDQTTAPTNKASSPTNSPNASAAYEKLIAYKTEDYGQQSIADFNTTLASTSDDQTTAPTNEALSPTISPNASAAYEKLIAYKTEDYGQQSIADFNTTLASTPDELTEFLAAVADVISTISPSDENYDFFTTTITFSSQELYCEHMREELTFSMPLSQKSRPCDYLDEDGETVYDFLCFVGADVAYSINAPECVTVAERDKALLTFQEEMQNYLNGLSEAEIAGGDIKKMLIDKSVELANSLSTENMKLSPCDIYMIEIHNAGTEIIK